MMHEMTQDEFLKLSTKGNLVPVYREIQGDLLTPVGAYINLAKGSDYAFLLESVEGGEKFARFSVIARQPSMIIESKNKKARVLFRSKNKKFVVEEREFTHSPLEIVRDILKDYKPVEIPQLPRFFGGLVGYLSYDCVRFFERLPDKTKDDLNVQDMVLMQADDVVIFDHRHRTIKLVSCVYIPKGDTQASKIKKYKQALKTIDLMAHDLHKPLAIETKKPSKAKLKIKSNLNATQFSQMVKKAKEHIHAGDIIQVVLSQRFEVDIKVSSVDIYRALRALNPSPYMFLLHLNGLDLVGASPELLVRSEQGLVETRPIAGTRPRGNNEIADEQLAKDLLNDPKERAEHVMLVDLGRNDLGRVCTSGSVELSEFMAIEKYSHVMHLVSNVKGKLRPDRDALDVLEASFPAGTVSGAPKIKAMSIIEHLEAKKRGPYAGAVGYVSFSKNLDMCITIRTIVVLGQKAYVQAGAGIVADSDPQSEYTETVNKAKAQIKAIELAHQ